MFNLTAVGIPIRHALVRMGFHVHTASTPEEAMAHLNKQNCEFIFVDMDGHVDHGGSLLTRLHKEYWDIIPIAVSERNHPQNVAHLIERGAYDCVTPTTTTAELRVVILRALKRFESEMRAKEAVKKRVEQLSQFSRASDELMSEIDSLKKEISLLQAQKEMPHYRPLHTYPE